METWAVSLTICQCPCLWRIHAKWSLYSHGPPLTSLFDPWLTSYLRGPWPLMAQRSRAFPSGATLRSRFISGNMFDASSCWRMGECRWAFRSCIEWQKLVMSYMRMPNAHQSAVWSCPVPTITSGARDKWYKRLTILTYIVRSPAEGVSNLVRFDNRCDSEIAEC